jgi:putative ABC transport system permease protein
MSLWRQVRRGVGVLLHREAADRELAEEVADYYQRAETDLAAGGLTADEAHRAVRRELGEAASVREAVRSYGWENVAESGWSDLRHAARRLRRSPGFTAIGVLTLALGIGASTAIFSVAYPILFAPLPYPHGERVVMLSDVGSEGEPQDVTYGTYIELAQRSRSFDALAVADRWQPTLTGRAEPQRLAGDRVSAGYFRVLGVAPAVGRAFDAADEMPGGPKVAILTAGLANRGFGGARAVLGRAITLNGDEYTVIGVMPPGFDNVLSPSAELWAPLQYRPHAPFQSAEWGHHLRMVGRLEPGVSLAQARRDVAGIARSRSAAFPRPPWASLQQGVIVASLGGAVTRGVRPALLAILGAVLLVLVIACVNVTNLLLARGAQRRGEMAMRAALGAGRRRLVRQLLTESLLLAVLGGVVGLGVAAVGARALMALTPAALPRMHAVHLSAPAFAFAFAITAIIGLGVGLAPALRGAGGDLRSGVYDGDRTTGGAHHALRRTLVVTEVALALVLLVSAGLLLRTVERLLSSKPGFDPSHLLTMQVVAAGHAFDSDAAKEAYFQQVLDAVHHVPAVTSAAFTSQLPLSGDLEGYGVRFQSIPGQGPNDADSGLRYAVTPDWFRTMRIPLVRGRLLDADDRPGNTEAVLINESFAKRRFPGIDPIGQRVRLGPEIGRTDAAWDVVVGVVGDVKQASLALGPPDAFYVAMGQWPWVDDAQSLVVRATGDAAALAPAIKRAIWSVNRDQPILRVATMDRLIAASEAQRRFALRIFEMFALAALALAAVGIYGVVASSVAERTREIGVRAALGASRPDILALVLRQGMTLAGIGIAIGLAGAAVATRALATLLFGVRSLDPLTYIGVMLLLAVVAAIACAAPAWRAARVDPSITLRQE